MRTWDVEEMVEGPMFPERVVALWWNRLTNAQRDALGRKVYSGSEIWADYRWRCVWDDLAPLGQQMRLHMYYDAMRRRQGAE
jgi:hypothetical protein